MKNIFWIFVLVAMLALPVQAGAASYYLTLSGTVGSIQDGGRLASAAGITVGDTLKYVVQIDTSQRGYTVAPSGKMQTKSKDSVFTSLFSGNLDGMTSKEYHYLDPHHKGFYSQTGNDLSAVEWQTWNQDYANLQIGSDVNRFTEFSYSDTWGYTRINLEGVTVTNITNVAPTPVPAAAYLMLGGLGVVGVVRRKLS